MISSQDEGKKKDARLHTHRRHTECTQREIHYLFIAAEMHVFDK